MNPSYMAAAAGLLLWATDARAQVAPVTDPSPAQPAPSPAPPQPPPASGQFKASLDDGLTARSTSGDFSLKLGFQSQFRAEFSNSVDRTKDAYFSMRQVRPQIRATLGIPWVKVFVQPELAGTSSRLLDFEADFRPHDAVGLKLGQFLTPFSRSFLTPVPRLQFPDFSAANDFFRADRDTGAMVFGTPFDGKVEYYAGVFNGNGIDKGGNDDKRMLWVGRLAASPLGAMPLDETLALAHDRAPRLSLGVNAYLGETTRTEQRADASTGLPRTFELGVDESNTAGADLAFSWGRFASLIEVYGRKAAGYDGKTKKAAGGFGQASVMVIDRLIEAAGRLSLIDPNIDATGDRIRAVEALLTGYVRGNHLKAQARYTNLHNDALASHKTTHIVTLQTQLFSELSRRRR